MSDTRSPTVIAEAFFTTKRSTNFEEIASLGSARYE
jgi:hypothetical protein